MLGRNSARATPIVWHSSIPCVLICFRRRRSISEIWAMRIIDSFIRKSRSLALPIPVPRGDEPKSLRVHVLMRIFDARSAIVVQPKRQHEDTTYSQRDMSCVGCQFY
jgi:hypothetical protein